MDWSAPAIILETRLWGEADLIVTAMTEAHGTHRGLARGGASRGQAAVWQPGNLVALRWLARLADQLGSFTAELVHPAAALAMDDPLALAMLTAATAVAAGALAEREAHPAVFRGLVSLIAHLAEGPPCCPSWSAGRRCCWPSSATGWRWTVAPSRGPPPASPSSPRAPGGR